MPLKSPSVQDHYSRKYDKWRVALGVVLLSVGLSCGGSHPPDNPLPSSCMGLHCAAMYKRFDKSCPQLSGTNNRTYAAATQTNLTVFFFYLVDQVDGEGNVTPDQQVA